LTGNISNTDPGFIKVGPFSVPVKDYQPNPATCLPLDEELGTVIAARLINEFVDKSGKVLEKSEINRKRVMNGKSAANILLFRDGGQTPIELPRFEDKFGRTLTIYGQIPAENAIAKLVGASFVSCRQGESDADDVYFASLLSKALDDSSGLLYIHIKNTDEPGHDGDSHGKIRAIESIDRNFIGPLTSRVGYEDLIILTSDHATPVDLMIHTADPVPVLVSGRGVSADSNRRFSESSARTGGLGAMRACELLPRVLGLQKI
jgi:2,3-bisphosphoglycerate-independent phosphoglycerate mutase